MPTAEVNGAQIYYEVQGDGPPLLLIPGLGTGGGYFKLSEPLLRRSCKTILVDPRGIGRSDKRDADFVAETWADDFAALLDHLKLAPAHVLGSSHGGCMAMAMADRHPDKFRSLILVGAFAELDRALALNFQLRIKMVAKLGLGDEIADHVALWTMRRDFLASPRGEEALGVLVGAVRQNAPERYMALCRSILHWGRKLPGQENEPTITPRLAGFRMPTLVVTGDSDHMIPASFSKHIADRIPGARYVEMPECGHIPFLERPDEVGAIIAGFVAEQASGKTA
jgi:pimeloyl-ACP methyl ester carboxylesterase